MDTAFRKGGTKMKCKTAIMVIFLLVACSSSALAGCYRSDCFFYTCDPRDDWGNAYTLARSGQILNPDAEANLEPVVGINGRAAANIMHKYVESFIKTQSQQSGGVMSSAVTQSSSGYTK
jgi:hypothetical protein